MQRGAGGFPTRPDTRFRGRVTVLSPAEAGFGIIAFPGLRSDPGGIRAWGYRLSPADAGVGCSRFPTLNAESAFRMGHPVSRLS
jgi:hypothetical protein